jgi:hypothetical protein
LFCLRYLPVLSLLTSCSVYTDSLLDQAQSLDTAGSQNDAGSSVNAGQGGRGSTGAGSGGSRPEQVGGDGGGKANVNGGSSTAGSGGKAPTGGDSATAAGMTGGGTTTAGNGGSGIVVDPPSGIEMLDDMEDGNQYLPAKPPRYGFWYVNGDASPGAKLVKIEQLITGLVPARAASTKAAHFTATGYVGWGATVGLSFSDAAQKRKPYDTGDAVGISFWVRGSLKASDPMLTVLFPIPDTDPSGTHCGGTDQGLCLDHYKTLVPVTADWKQITVLFSSLHQGGWGAPVDAFEPEQLLGIEWSAADAAIDVWLDDLALLRP